MYTTTNLCCLCLNKSSDVQEFSQSDISDIVQKLHKMIPQTKLQTEDRQFVCRVCLITARELHRFLSKFFETNFRICHKLKVSENLKLNIRMLQPEMYNEELDDICICRICLSSVPTPEVFLYESETNLLHYEWYFEILSYCDIDPKLLDLTTDPVMCSSCWQDLQILFTFKKIYFELHGEILRFDQELQKRNVHESDRKLLLQNFRQLSKNTTETANQVDISHFSKNKILELLFLYLLTTENESNVIPEFWKKSLNVWNDLNKDDPITELEMLTFVTLLLKGTLISTDECDLIKSQIVQFGNIFRGRKRSSSSSQHQNSELQQTALHQRNYSQLTSSNFPTSGDYDDYAYPDLTNDMIEPIECKSEPVEDDEITMDYPDLEDQTNVSDICDKTFAEVKTFQESIIKTDYYYKCHKCTFKTTLKLAAIKHSMLHNKGASRRSIRLQNERDSVNEFERTVDSGNLHDDFDKGITNSTRPRSRAKNMSAEVEEAPYRMSSAVTGPRKCPVWNRRKGLLARVRGRRYLNKSNK